MRLILRRGIALAMAAALGMAPARLVLAETEPPTAPPPVAMADTFSATEDEALVVPAPGLLANDNPAPATCVTGTDVGDLAGSLEVQADGSFSYTPPANFHGDTTFGYGIRTSSDAQCIGPPDSQATVTITVAAVNDAPTATGDSFLVLKDRTLNVGAPGVLMNDHDVDGDSLAAVKVTNPSHGVVILAADGAFGYTPAAGYVGFDAFSYRASDGSLSSPIRVVSLTISAIPPSPTPAPTATPAPTPTPEPTLAEPTQTIEASPTIEPTLPPGATVAPSPSPSPTPAPTAAPGPTAGDDGGLSLPALLLIVLLGVLLAFGAAVYVPRWLRAQGSGPPDQG